MDPFQALQQSFPDLKFKKIDAPVDEAFVIPVQPGLKVEVGVNRQNGDELHLTIGNAFWCEWFPTSCPEVVHDYIDAVSGFIEGRVRLVELYKGKRASGGDLEAQSEAGWHRIARYRKSGVILSFGKTRRVIVRNSED